MNGARETLSLSPAPIWIVETGLTGNFPGGHNKDFIKVFEEFWFKGYTAFYIESDTKNKITEQQVLDWVKNLDTEGHYNFHFQKEK
jgi:hypothetical protein